MIQKQAILTTRTRIQNYLVGAALFALVGYTYSYSVYKMRPVRFDDVEPSPRVDANKKA